MWIMNIILYKPIANIVAQRKKYLDDNMEITNKISDTLVRLPMYFDLEDNSQEYIIETSVNFLENKLC